MSDRTVFANLFHGTCRAGVLGFLLSALAALGGCAGQTARMDLDSEDDALLGAMSSKDFRAACFQMAQSLIRLPQIQNAANPPTLAFTEVVNASDELFSTDDLLYKIRTELIKNCGGKILFLDRDILDQMRDVVEPIRVARVNPETGMAVLDIGSSDGVAPGTAFLIETTPAEGGPPQTVAAVAEKVDLLSSTVKLADPKAPVREGAAAKRAQPPAEEKPQEQPAPQ